jgi:hypothetical protein
MMEEPDKMEEPDMTEESGVPCDKVLAVLAKHFPASQLEDRRDAVSEIEMVVGLGLTREAFDARTRSSNADIKNLENARKHLEAAKKSILQIGLWGSERLRGTARQLEAFETGLDLEDCSPLTEVTAPIAEYVSKLLDVLPVCDTWQKDLTSDNEMVSKKGRPNKHQARYLSLILYGIFERLSGRKPTISKDPVSERRYGPFLSFVEDTFDTLGIDGNSENAAVYAVGLKSP